MQCREKTCLQGFEPGQTQTGLYSYRKWLEASNSEGLYYLCGENKDAGQVCSYCAADFAFAESRFSHDAAHISVPYLEYKSYCQGLLKIIFVIANSKEEFSLIHFVKNL